jgi:signal transduction histidine kinase
MNTNSNLGFSTLLASSVHDMKNSVTMLLLNVQDLLAELSPETETQKKQLSKLEYEATRINNDLIQLLTLYKLDEKTLSADIDEFSVIELIAEQLVRNESLLAYKNIVINLDCDENLHWYLDAELIGSVLNNLLVNAARYAKSRINIVVTQADAYLQISIEDDGDGFPAQMLAKDQTNEYISNRLISSTQLGLLFAERILALHSSGKNKGYLSLSNGGIQAGAKVELFIP